ncbi:MAG: DUF885 domain-containing protein, partial [Henriciella sp.]
MRIGLTALALVLAACGPSTGTTNSTDTTTSGAETAATDTAAPTAEEIEAETAALNAWFDEKYEEQLMMSPIQLTFQGRKDRYGEIDDMSVEAAEEQLAWRAATVEEMKSTFDYDKLTPEAKNSWDIWEYQYELAEEGMQFFYDNLQFDQMSGPQSFLPTLLIQFHRVDTLEDMEAYVSRISEGARALDQLLDISAEAQSRGVTTPDFAYEGVIDQSRKVITGAPFTEGEPSDIWADIQTEISTLQEKEVIDAETAERLTEEARTALVEAWQPAYERVIAWAEEGLENAPANPSGIGTTQPNGVDYYNYRLRAMTTTDMTADEIHQIGLDEVARIQGEMEAIK